MSIVILLHFLALKFGTHQQDKDHKKEAVIMALKNLQTQQKKLYLENKGYNFNKIYN